MTSNPRWTFDDLLWSNVQNFPGIAVPCPHLPYQRTAPKPSSLDYNDTLFDDMIGNARRTIYGLPLAEIRRKLGPYETLGLVQRKRRGAQRERYQDRDAERHASTVYTKLADGEDRESAHTVYMNGKVYSPAEASGLQGDGRQPSFSRGPRRVFVRVPISQVWRTL